MKIPTSAIIVLALATAVHAQDVLTIELVESEEFGQYLADAEGRPLYRFTTDTQASDGQEAQVSCTSSDCLENWPLVTSSDDPVAGEGVDASLLGTVEYEGQQVVTYDGWPLYYFAHDEGVDEPQGNAVESFGGEWFLATAESDTADVAPSDTADVSAGETQYASTCAQCHGRTGAGMAAFPPIAGHDAEYITTRLMQYKAGESVGPNSGLMIPVAQQLSDEEIANLAAFISTNFQ